MSNIDPLIPQSGPEEDGSERHRDTAALEIIGEAEPGIFGDPSPGLVDSMIAAGDIEPGVRETVEFHLDDGRAVGLILHSKRDVEVIGDSGLGLDLVQMSNDGYRDPITGVLKRLNLARPAEVQRYLNTNHGRVRLTRHDRHDLL